MAHEQSLSKRKYGGTLLFDLTEDVVDHSTTVALCKGILKNKYISKVEEFIQDSTGKLWTAI